MVRTTRIKPNEKLAPKLTYKSFTPIGKVLAFIGRPFYFLLLYLTLAVLLILNITGRTSRALSHLLFLKFPKLITSFFDGSLKTLNKLVTNLSFKVKKTKQIYPRHKNRLLALPKKYVRSIFSVYDLFRGLSKKAAHLYIPINKLSPRRWLKILSLRLRLKTIRLPSVARLKVSKLKVALVIFGIIITTLSLTSYFFWKQILVGLPKPEDLLTRKQNVSTKIYDRNKVLLYNIYQDQNRTPVPLDRIPAQVRLATVAIEDADFYNHKGISLRGIGRAALTLIKDRKVTGGSTITQQLIKNTLLSPEKTLTRKLKEVVLALQVEHAFSKDEILSMYLNEVSYGGTAYGTQEAAQVYFDKNVDQLTLGEAALLAGLPKSPSTFSPFGHNPELAYERQKEVLHLMRVNGFITDEQKKLAENEKITFAKRQNDIKAPHFVMYVRKILADKYGEEFVTRGGLTVITTLDLSIQKLAEEAVKSEIEKLKDLGVGNGAAIVLDTKTGEILAMVGSHDYFAEKDGNVNLVLSPRQPGSSIKVVNYAYALSHGYTPATILEDTPVTFNVDGLPPYTPRNYDGEFRGKLSLRNALAESRNIPAVKVLESYGVVNMIEQGKKMGISTWEDSSNYGLSLTLGGGEVKLIDLAQVYASIANYGKKPGIKAVSKVTTYEGRVLEENKCKKVNQVNLVNRVNQEGHNYSINLINSVNLVGSTYASESAIKTDNPTGHDCEMEQVIDPRVSFMLIDILKDGNARSPSFGSNSLLVIPKHPEVAVKTGTSNDLRDNLTIGFNQKYLVAVWVGNNDNTPMERIASGITGATPIWNKILTALIANNKSEAWQVPSGLISLPVCTLTNSLACEGCFSRQEWFLEENKPIYACNPEYIKYLNEQKEKESEPELEDKDNDIETANVNP